MPVFRNKFINFSGLILLFCLKLRLYHSASSFSTLTRTRYVLVESMSSIIEDMIAGGNFQDGENYGLIGC